MFRSTVHYWRNIYQLQDLDSAIYQLRRSVALKFVDKLNLPSESLILEIGCGAGLTTVALAQRGFQVHAVDTVDDMLALTNRAVREAAVGERVKTWIADAHALGLPDDSVDLVVAMGVVPWLQSLPKAMHEMARVVKPGGHVILTTDNFWCLHYLLDPLRFPGFQRFRWKLRKFLESFGLAAPRAPRPHLSLYSIKQMDKFGRNAGMLKIEGKTLGFGPFTFFNQSLFSEKISLGLHRALQRLADSGFPVLRSTGIEYVVLARKPAETHPRQN
ncbi:MAG: class I SAM-dependent methyltransferase [Candidatus Acidiferrales bacterium]